LWTKGAGKPGCRGMKLALYFSPHIHINSK
jgi:hypothetical protein